jgi:hypothetical protein
MKRKHTTHFDQQPSPQKQIIYCTFPALMSNNTEFCTENRLYFCILHDSKKQTPVISVHNINCATFMKKT